MRRSNNPFKPKARLLLELGNELIRDEGIAIFELVKNSYDADATEVNVTLKNIDSIKDGEITILDNGTGMDWNTVTKVWLEPGTNYKEDLINNGIKTKKFKRTPLGQKGIGRFGAHKLGSKISLITKSKDDSEILVEVDWTKFEENKYLDEIPVKVIEREPEIFVNGKTGTLIKITNLWNPWNRGMIRNVYRSVNSISSPFNSQGSFKTIFELKDEDKQDWLKGLLSWKDAIESKLYLATCTIDGSTLSYSYEFKPWKTMYRVDGRKRVVKSINLIDLDDNPIDLNKFKIGKVVIDIYIYDLDANILALGVSDKKGLKEFIKFNGGLRVYRDGIRVYDYGEPGTDWLDLGTRRVNVPTDHLSNNIMIGAVSLNKLNSSDLIEKTNREGFIENDAMNALRNAVIFSLAQIEAERNSDKKRIRNAYSKTAYREPVLDAISELREKLKKKGVLSEYDLFLNRIETDFKDVKEKLLTTAGAGLSLSIVIHEIEKIISELKYEVEKVKSSELFKKKIIHLSDLIEGYASLVRKGGSSKIKASELIDQAIFNVTYRFSAHNIELINGCSKENDFDIKCSKKLILGAIMNLIDNSIWWIENKNSSRKIIYIAPSKDISGFNAIVVADSGPGFLDSVEDVVIPFFSRKPDGMGLGLHITEEIMKSHNGKFAILEKNDVTLPKYVDGAVVALLFGENK